MSASKRLIISYVLDWIIILLPAIAGCILKEYVSPTQRPFSPLDLSISYPLIEESISSEHKHLIAILGPTVIITLVTLLFIPSSSQPTPKRYITTLKLWELEKGLAGLALSCAWTFFLTEALKNISGKPRPNFLEHCRPDLRNIAEHIVGHGYGRALDRRWALVDSSICMGTNLDRAYSSFPSGHSSGSWAGLLYLSLFLCAKFSIWFPGIPTLRTKSSDALSRLPSQESQPSKNPETVQVKEDPKELESGQPETSPRNQAASPPNYFIVLAFLPTAVAIYISFTRYAEYYHFASDIIAGSLIGIFTATFAFRWYHQPLGEEGWAWGPRSPYRGFGVRVGVKGYVE